MSFWGSFYGQKAHLRVPKEFLKKPFDTSSEFAKLLDLSSNERSTQEDNSRVLNELASNPDTSRQAVADNLGRQGSVEKKTIVPAGLKFR